ncbi:MAG: hypothetical protein LBC02_04625 [Planctomycetaceae bacterium]|nr:hypothetical protein [Planctomycetaceae bacterium]
MNKEKMLLDNIESIDIITLCGLGFVGASGIFHSKSSNSLATTNPKPQIPNHKSQTTKLQLCDLLRL